MWSWLETDLVASKGWHQWHNITSGSKAGGQSLAAHPRTQSRDKPVQHLRYWPGGSHRGAPSASLQEELIDQRGSCWYPEGHWQRNCLMGTPSSSVMGNSVILGSNNSRLQYVVGSNQLKRKCRKVQADVLGGKMHVSPQLCSHFNVHLQQRRPEVLWMH